MTAALLVGIFVGGRGSRMGGIAKGNLTSPDGASILLRLLSVVKEAVPASPLVLVGNASAYADFDLPALPDTPSGIGPLGGLSALLAHAERLQTKDALVLACDLPYLEAALVRRLASEFPEARALAPRDGQHWSALTARYAVAALPLVQDGIARGDHSLQRIFTLLGDEASLLPVDDRERAELRDWDSPADIVARP